MKRHGKIPAVAAGVLFFFQCIGTVHGADRPRLVLHENYIEEVTRSCSLPLDEPTAIFAYVLESLGDRARVYPTENYYYFSFVCNGVGYSGNIRLDAKDRDQGKLHFAYFEDFAAWRPRPHIRHIVLEAADGVTVTRVESLLYRVSFKTKAVLFELNDLSTAAPPASALAPDEIYIGPVFDDSAVRFFLIYNERLKSFLYLLDEAERVTDDLVPSHRTGRILIGKRTGFAFYRDGWRNRKILIGVLEQNARDNNHLDGPFDQLPTNFIEDDRLRQSILQVNPELADKIDRFGSFLDGSGRYLIAPYLHYRSERDLAIFDRCARRNRATSKNYYKCFVVIRTARR